MRVIESTGRFCFWCSHHKIEVWLPENANSNVNIFDIEKIFGGTTKSPKGKRFWDFGNKKGYVAKGLRMSLMELKRFY